MLSDADPETRKIAGKSLSEVLEHNKRIFGMILNVISRDRFIEDNKRGFKRIMSSRNLDNDVEDEVVDKLVNTVDKAMPKLTTGGTAVSWEDLGGPTPQNSKPDDDSNKVKTPGGTIKQVSDVVTNRKGKTGAMGVQSASNLKQGDEAELTDEQEVVAETCLLYTSPSPRDRG